MKSDLIEVGLEIKVYGEDCGKKADLCTDGVNELWIPHSVIKDRIRINDNLDDHILSLPRWFAKEKGII